MFRVSRYYYNWKGFRSELVFTNVLALTEVMWCSGSVGLILWLIVLLCFGVIHCQQDGGKYHGLVEDCCCDYETVDRINKEALHPMLQQIVKHPFFRYFKVLSYYCFAFSCYDPTVDSYSHTCLIILFVVYMNYFVLSML